MDDQLLVRVYNVGLGDCIYVRVPDNGGAKHLLIDCGNKFGTPEALEAAVEDLKQILPEVPGTDRRRLDLLVATHAHEDHVKGFDAGLFDGLQIDRLWMSTAMNPDHPQAEKARELQSLTLQALQRLALSPKAGLADWSASMLGLSKAEGMDALLRTLPVGKRVFVHMDTPVEDLELFEDNSIQLRVLAPVNDIDGVYLGKEMAEGLPQFSLFLDATDTASEGAEAQAGAPPEAGPARPTNVSPEDFELLRNSLTDGALAFVLKEGELVNNTSVVLLLTWQGRRLLFTGDAEVKTSSEGQFQPGKANGSWNTMWHFKETELAKPVDFLKVGHHGSHNATPWTSKKSGDTEHPINAILESLLPLPIAGQSRPERYAVVSTERTNGYPMIPDPALMMELGRRVSNIQGYREPATKKHFVPEGEMQPQRTDLEGDGKKRVPWIDVKLSPMAG
ncbi:MAG TPA: MBL fold metallo-hydrolase [Thermoanaerobaculia bacterium]|nr:MBL fold metallo-hydrolase [Thermoanaerobaculia bacterium]